LPTIRPAPGATLLRRSAVHVNHDRLSPQTGIYTRLRGTR
jgi:hypothetical protein